MKFNLKEYLDRYFQGVKLESPLFYHSPIGIRFELGVPYRGVEDPSYLVTAQLRATTIFESIFKEHDDLILVVQSFSYMEPYKSFKEEKSVLTNQYMRKELLSEVERYESSLVVDEEDDALIGYSNAYWVRCQRSDLKYSTLFKAIGNHDFDQEPYITDGVFLVNLTSNIILHMYDDRGLDVIASDKASLKAIYQVFNSWILDYDRERIDGIFAEQPD